VFTLSVNPPRKIIPFVLILGDIKLLYLSIIGVIWPIQDLKSDFPGLPLSNKFYHEVWEDLREPQKLLESNLLIYFHDFSLSSSDYFLCALLFVLESIFYFDEDSVA